jgi:3-phosphoshikimate 1-carboxyvinyltransferase
VPGDYALSAFYMVLSALAGFDLRITNLMRGKAVEGEYAFITHAKEMGVEIEDGDDYVLIKGSQTKELDPVDVDLSDSPDITMPLALLMARAKGKSKVMGVSHIIHKESNRLRGIAEVLKCLGAGVSVDEVNGIIEIEGVNEFRGGCEVDTQGDHRIIMMGVVGGLLAKEGVVINDWEGVGKSWPTFIWDLERLGAIFKYA